MGNESRARRLAWYAVVVLLSAILGAVVADSAKVRVLEPGQATEAEVMRAVRELRVLMQEAGESQAEIDRTIHELRCKYLPETTEGCDHENRGKDQEQRQAENHEPQEVGGLS